MANLFSKYVFQQECVQIPLVETGDAKGVAYWILPGVLRDGHVSPPADLARPIGLRFFLLTFGPSKIHFNLTANGIPIPCTGDPVLHQENGGVAMMRKGVRNLDQYLTSETQPILKFSSAIRLKCDEWNDSRRTFREHLG